MMTVLIVVTVMTTIEMTTVIDTMTIATDLMVVAMTTIVMIGMLGFATMTLRTTGIEIGIGIGGIWIGATMRLSTVSCRNAPLGPSVVLL